MGLIIVTCCLQELKASVGAVILDERIDSAGNVKIARFVGRSKYPPTYCALHKPYLLLSAEVKMGKLNICPILAEVVKVNPEEESLNENQAQARRVEIL